MHINVTIFVCINIYVNSLFWAEVKKLDFDAARINVFGQQQQHKQQNGRVHNGGNSVHLCMICITISAKFLSLKKQKQKQNSCVHIILEIIIQFFS